jgi:hypothetical protein
MPVFVNAVVGELLPGLREAGGVCDGSTSFWVSPEGELF